MSFGFGFGDTIKICELSWTVYRSCKGAPGEFQEISREVITLHTVLRDLIDDANNERSLLNRRGAQRKEELLTIIQHIEVVLKELDDLVNRYQNLGRDQRRTWDRVRFATENIETIRGKLTFHTAAIGLFLNSLSTGSLARIESVLDDMVREVRAGRRAPSIVSVSETDDQTIWRELEQELAEEGISRQDVQRHKEAIRIYLRSILRRDSRTSSFSDGLTAIDSDDDDDDDDENRASYDGESLDSLSQGYSDDETDPEYHQFPRTEQQGSQILIPPLRKKNVKELSKIWDKTGHYHGVLSGGKAKDILDRSELPNDILGKIWNLADTHQHGRLNKTEFVVAIHLASSYKGGSMTEVPPKLPSSLFNACLNDSEYIHRTSNLSKANRLLYGPAHRASILFVDQYHGSAATLARACMGELIFKEDLVHRCLGKVGAAGVMKRTAVSKCCEWDDVKRAFKKVTTDRLSQSHHREFHIVTEGDFVNYDYVIYLGKRRSDVDALKKVKKSAMTSKNSAYGEKLGHLSTHTTMPRLPEMIKKSKLTSNSKHDEHVRKAMEAVFDQVKVHCLKILRQRFSLVQKNGVFRVED